MSIRRHDKATAEAIFNMIDWQESVVIRDDGVYLNEDFRAYSPRDSVFDWTPAYDMDWEGAPNPITAPVLPIPFTINELAACMLDGPGSGIYHVLDSRIGYPLNEEALCGFSLRYRKVAEAIREAYASASEAQNLVGEYDHDAEQKAHEQLHQFDEANDLANEREGVFESEITPEEADERRARARASVAELKKRAQEAKAEADMKWNVWRKAMVHHLLGNRPLQQVQIAQENDTTQNEQLKEQEALYEAALSRLEEANKARERREALLAAPEKLGSLSELEALEAAVSAARQEAEAARQAICVMRGDYLDASLETQPNPKIGQPNVLAGTETAKAASVEHTCALTDVRGMPKSQELIQGPRLSQPDRNECQKRGSQPALNPEQKAEIERLFRQRVSVNKLATMYPASRRTIDEALKEAGLKPYVTLRKQKKGAQFQAAPPLGSRMK